MSWLRLDRPRQRGCLSEIDGQAGPRTDVGNMRRELQTFEECDGVLERSFDREGDDAAKAVRAEGLQRQLVRRMGLESAVGDGRHFGMTFEVSGIVIFSMSSPAASLTNTNRATASALEQCLSARRLRVSSPWRIKKQDMALRHMPVSRSSCELLS